MDIFLTFVEEVFFYENILLEIFAKKITKISLKYLTKIDIFLTIVEVTVGKWVW